MKYQGFYDYSLDDSGNPDRTFTAKQFCMYLKGLLGNGIGITNATGDNAWKLEKTGELTAKITLGNNGYNFASLDGNPFIIDEELEFTFSQGADRWDAILIRANSTLEVRATDVVIQENDISYTRSTDIYDLRIARVHIVDNIITEIIDDRLNNEYCGIADGLTTVPTSELEQLLEEVKNGSLVALKDGILQKQLNAEMCGGNSLNLILLYNKITSKIAEKEFQNEKDTMFDSSKNTFVANVANNDYSYGEYRIVAGGLSNVTSYDSLENIIDNDDSTYTQLGWTTSGGGYIEFMYPKAVNISKINLHFNVTNGASYFNNWLIQASNDESTWTTLYTGNSTSFGAEYLTFANEEYYKYYRIVWNTSSTNYSKRIYIYRIDPYITGTLPEYNLLELDEKMQDYINGMRIMIEASNLVNAYPTYLSVNEAIPKLISSDIENDKKYELVYDGAMFNAREVV